MTGRNKIDTGDTIAAISTPSGEGAIGIVRLSGKGSLGIADKVFRPNGAGSPSGFRSFTVHYGHIVDGNSVVDEALLTVMRAPKSYTKEDMAEINCHGGIVPLRKTLELVLAGGARLAEPGEFTKRAFLNGRIDLTQAEAVLDVIRSKTDESLAIALGQLDGRLSSILKGIREELASVSAGVEASIDFPEEDIEIISEAGTKARLEAVRAQLAGILETADKGIIMREGISCVICGKPNVGKSSLLNALLRKDRAIVTHVPGTTRDTIEEYANIEGIPFRLVDTAGITATEDIVEREGVLRSREHMERSGLILLMLDGSSAVSGEDRALLEDTRSRARIIVINKADLPRKISASEFPGICAIEISAKSGKGLERLRKAMAGAVFSGKARAGEPVAVTNLRQKEAARSALSSVEAAIDAVDGKLPPELIAVEVNESLGHIADIVGETVNEEILDRIFSQFCIGK
ncbi:MAG: tRNA uridine-5-carboxymethylaminomethyl(34) synthesis GTPase MnmE [Candidatus Omnitrophica bacterium]|jgi:tRNA modification GTPase|nr:tRNA uridine-5-carboxymethylaminomethyl(34) synthesis GTPase MnmE [Candidatus Omnitrophota bacterium]